MTLNSRAFVYDVTPREPSLMSIFSRPANSLFRESPENVPGKITAMLHNLTECREQLDLSFIFYNKSMLLE